MDKPFYSRMPVTLLVEPWEAIATRRFFSRRLVSDHFPIASGNATVACPICLRCESAMVTLATTPLETLTATVWSGTPSSCVTNQEHDGPRGDRQTPEQAMERAPTEWLPL
jgi:hypothetical protein